MPLFRASLLILILALGGCGPDSSVEEAPEKEPLVVAMELNYPPFEMKDKEGNPEGLSVDLAQALAEHLGRELEVRDIAWDGLIPSVQSGRADCVISSMTITEPRAMSVDFSDPYVTSGICMLIHADSPVQSAADLNHPDRKVTVKLGTTGHVYAKENFPKAQIQVLKDAANCSLAVAQGRADAFLYDQITIYKFWRNNQETTRPMLNPVQTEYWGIAVQKGDAELLADINAFLTEFREEGGFKELGEKWFHQWEMDFEKLGVRFFFR